MGLRARWKALSRRRRRLLKLAGAVGLWAVLGFLVVPPVLRSQLEKTLHEQLHRPARVDQVRFNPFALSLTVRGLSVTDLDGLELAGFDELYVNFQLSSLFRRAWTFDTFHLVVPRARLIVGPDGLLSITDLLPPDDAPPPPAAPSEPPPLLVFHLDVDRGRFDFEDRSRSTPFTRSFTPIDVHLKDFTTRRDGQSPYEFHAQMGTGQKLDWQGDITANPLRSSGTLAISDIRFGNLVAYADPFPRLKVTEEARLAIGGQYSFDGAGDGARFTLAGGEVTLRDVTVLATGEAEPLLVLPGVSVTGVAVDSAACTASIASVVLTEPAVRVRRQPDGSIEAATAFEPKAAPAAPPATTAGAPPAAPAPPWTITLDDLSIDRANVRWQDRATPEPVDVRLQPLDVTLQHFASRPGTTMDVTFAATADGDGSGTIRTAAKVVLEPLSVDAQVDLAGIDLAPHRPYLADVAHLQRFDGKLDLRGRLTLPGAGAAGDAKSGAAAPMLSFAGDLGIRELQTGAEGSTDPLLSWAALSLTGIALDLEPTRVDVATVEARDLAALFALEADGTSNLDRALGTAGRAAAEDATAGAAPPAAPTAAPSAASPAAEDAAAAPVPVAIRELRLVNVALDFADRTVTPPFTSGLDALNGSVTGWGLGEFAEPRIGIDLHGKVRGEGPLDITGWLSLPDSAGRPLGTQLKIAAQAIALTAFSPYAGKYAGYAIAKGTLKLDLAYAIDGGALEGQNRVVMEHFNFGSAVESPDATALPVRLAVALLKDRNGVIDLDVPVSGNLDAPDFSYGGVVWGAFFDLLTKAVTSPFSMIGGLFGGGEAPEDLDRIAFAAGSAEVVADEQPKLDTLAAALAERPALLLEIHGAADPLADRRALAERELDRRLATRHAADYKLWGYRTPPDPKDVVVNPRDMDRLLRGAYEEAFREKPELLLARRDEEAAARGESPPGGAAASAWLVLAMRDRLIGTITIDDDAVIALAAARGQAVRSALLSLGTRDEQLVPFDPVLEGQVEDQHFDCPLTLTGS